MESHKSHWRRILPCDVDALLAHIVAAVAAHGKATLAAVRAGPVIGHPVKMLPRNRVTRGGGGDGDPQSMRPSQFAAQPCAGRCGQIKSDGVKPCVAGDAKTDKA